MNEQWQTVIHRSATLSCSGDIELNPGPQTHKDSELTLADVIKVMLGQLYFLEESHN